MQARIIVGDYPWNSSHPDELPHLSKLQASLMELFAEFNPRLSKEIRGTYGYPGYDLDVPADSVDFENKLKEFDARAKKNKPRSAVVLWESPSAKEVARARFLEPYYSADYVDEGPLRKPLNPGMRLCDECDRPNLKRLPEPFLVNKDVKKKYDVFHTSVSMIVVRPNVLELMQQAVGDQIQFGEARMAGATSAAKGDDRLFWVRPKHAIGQRHRIIKDKTPCPACKRQTPAGSRSTDDLVRDNGAGVLDDRPRVEHFGKRSLDIALVPEPDDGWLWPEIAMSGALLAYFKANGVKGISSLVGQYPAKCYFSAKREATLDPEARTFGAASSADKSGAAKKKSKEAGPGDELRKALASLKKVPWDCQADGHVYFQLSTPEFVVMDPMTGEEDSEGAYTVKNFKGPGLYRLPVSAIKRAREDGSGVAVDSATLVFVDNEHLAAFADAYEWDKANKKNGDFDLKYHDRIAEKIGIRFGICSPPPKKSKSQFEGDGCYSIDAKLVQKAAVK